VDDTVDYSCHNRNALLDCRHKLRNSVHVLSATRKQFDTPATPTEEKKYRLVIRSPRFDTLIQLHRIGQMLFEIRLNPKKHYRIFHNKRRLSGATFFSHGPTIDIIVSPCSLVIPLARMNAEKENGDAPEDTLS